MFVQSEPLEDFTRVNRQYFGCRPTGIDSQQNGYQPANNEGIAVAAENKARTVGFADQPDLADASLNLVRCRMFLGAQRIEVFTELDDVAISLLPIVQEGKIFNQGFDAHLVLFRALSGDSGRELNAQAPPGEKPDGATRPKMLRMGLPRQS